MSEVNVANQSRVVRALSAGLDQEQPGCCHCAANRSLSCCGDYMNASKLTASLKNGTLSAARVDDAALRVLRQMFAVGVVDNPVSNASDVRRRNVTSEAQRRLAREFSAEATVMLQNRRGLLPLSGSELKLAVLGWADGDHVMCQ